MVKAERMLTERNIATMLRANKNDKAASSVSQSHPLKSSFSSSILALAGRQGDKEPLLQCENILT